MANPNIPEGSRPAFIEGGPIFSGERMTLAIETRIPITQIAATTTQLRMKNLTPPASSALLVFNKADMDGVPASVVQDVTNIQYHFDVPASPDGQGLWEYQWTVDRNGYDTDFFAGTFTVSLRPL